MYRSRWQYLIDFTLRSDQNLKGKLPRNLRIVDQIGKLKIILKNTVANHLYNIVMLNLSEDLHFIQQQTDILLYQPSFEILILNAFFLGLSGKLTKQGVSFCISTAFEGTYLDSYYVDILIQQPLRIQHHSIPVFIPLEQIAHEHLQKDIKCFLSVLSDHLNAYARRKFQVDQLQVRGEMVLSSPMSLCMHFVNF